MEATRQIREALPAAKVPAWAHNLDAAYVDQVMALGASGYLLNRPRRPAQRRRRCGKSTRAGPSSSAPPLPGICSAGPASPGPTGRRPDRVGPAQPAGGGGAQLIAEGRPNKQAAAELGISVKTVEKHRQRLMEKLDIHDTVGGTRYAIAAGIVESSVQATIV